MAKYNNGIKNIDCDILNESGNSYVVRMKNGNIKLVDKCDVHSLNEMDNAVLNTIRKAGENIGKFGRRVVSKTKDVVSKIKEFVLKAFKMNNRVYLEDENGELVKAIHPINTMLGASENGGVTFIPNEEIVEMSSELGISPKAVYGYEFPADPYKGSFFFDTNMETVMEQFDIYSPTSSDYEKSKLNESKEKITGENKIYLNSDKFVDYPQERIYDMLKRNYLKFTRNYDSMGGNFKSYPVVPYLFGAPGVGKTAIIRQLGNELGIPVITMNAGAIEPEMFTMPGIVDDVEDFDNKDVDITHGKIFGNKKIKDLPKGWIPCYDLDVKGLSKEEAEYVLQQRKWAANGAIPDEHGVYHEDGKGGILFIDEFARMSLAGITSIFDFPLNRYFGTNSNIVLGDKWMIVCASNRYDDLSGEACDEAVAMEAASGTRYLFINYVPSKESWLKYGEEKVRFDGMDFSKVNKNIRDFVDENSKGYIRKDETGKFVGDISDSGYFYDLEELDNGKQEFTTRNKSHAIPRTWEQLSKDYMYIVESEGKQYTDPDDLIMEYLDDPEFIDMTITQLGNAPAQAFMEYLRNKSVFGVDDAVNVLTDENYKPSKKLIDAYTSAVSGGRGEKDINAALEKMFGGAFKSGVTKIMGPKDAVPQDGIIKLLNFVNNLNINKKDTSIMKATLDILMKLCRYRGIVALSQLPDCWNELKRIQPQIVKELS